MSSEKARERSVAAAQATDEGVTRSSCKSVRTGVHSIMHNACACMVVQSACVLACPGRPASRLLCVTIKSLQLSLQMVTHMYALAGKHMSACMLAWHEPHYTRAHSRTCTVCCHSRADILPDSCLHHSSCSGHTCRQDQLSPGLTPVASFQARATGRSLDPTSTRASVSSSTCVD